MSIYYPSKFTHLLYTSNTLLLQGQAFLAGSGVYIKHLRYWPTLKQVLGFSASESEKMLSHARFCLVLLLTVATRLYGASVGHEEQNNNPKVTQLSGQSLSFVQNLSWGMLMH